MINLYFGRAESDRTQFMYEKTAQSRAESNSSALIIVPDQYTLEAEKRAFSVLKTNGLMDVDIMSFSRMALKMTSDADGRKFIDDMGRSMLLKRVISSEKERLGLFAPVADKMEFISMMGSIIQEFKQYKVKPDEITELAEKNKEQFSGRMLMKKLSDVAVIYEAYEEALQEGYADTEDQLIQLCEEIEKSSDFENTEVWINGFEFFTKRLLSVIEKLAIKAGNLNVVLVYDRPGCADYNLFAPVEGTIREIKAIGNKCGIPVSMERIPDSYDMKQNEDILHLHRNLYAFPYEKRENEAENIFMWKCENREAETERAAAEIRRLVQHEGYRFKDIAIASGDMNERESLIKRIFPKHGILFFDNSKVSGICSRFMQFIQALCRNENVYMSNDSIFAILESGVLDITIEEQELLENYAEKFGIKGSMWNTDFYKIEKPWKKTEETEAKAEEELKRINDIRARFVSVLNDMYERFTECTSGAQYAEAFFGFLKETVKMDEIIQLDSDRLKAESSSEFAEITSQLWNKTVQILDQLIEIMGDAECTQGEFLEILRTGVESLNLSIIPAGIDQVLVGDLNTVRLSGVKVVMMLGLNEGVVPSGNIDNGIFSRFEKTRLNDIAGEICVSEGSNKEKEKLSIYQTFALPSDRLYLSHVTASGDDKEMSPSQLILRSRSILAENKEEKVVCEDITRRGELEYKSRINYIAETGEGNRGLVYTIAGVEYRNRERRISSEHFESLYGNDLRLSPTSIESYAHCPFAHFLKYGIRADERRVFEVSSPEMGTVFHEVLMEFSQKAADENLWSVADRELCRKITGELAERIASEHKSGFMFEGPLGKYRISRIKSICEKTAFMISSHVNKGSFDKFYFEMPFGQGRTLPAVEVPLSDGRKISIEGRIDRIDIASSENGTLVKVIDYKSGSDEIVKQQIVSGYKLQLMLYITAAVEGMKQKTQNVSPAGVFYFKIKEPSIKSSYKDMEKPDKFDDKLDKDFRKEYKMDGILVNEPEVIDSLDKDFTGWSEIIRVRKLKSGDFYHTDFAAMDRNSFNELMDNTRTKVEGFCEDFATGNVNVLPGKTEGADSCTYCQFKSICGFDERIAGFRHKKFK